jgi:hypothetical protein
VPAATATAPTPLIQWAHLGQIVLVSLIAGVGVVALVAGGVYALSRAHRVEATPAIRLSARLGAAICALAVLVTVGWGLYLIAHKG